MVGGGINYSTVVYGPAFDMFARPVTFFPVVSQPTGLSFVGRGIYDTDELEVQTMDGLILSDQQTLLYIREVEFTVLPSQRDRIYIDEADAGPALGWYEIIDATTNGGGETKLVLRRVSIPTRPPFP
jgi:hypothetical protein